MPCYRSVAEEPCCPSSMEVTEHRRRDDWAHCIKDLVDVHYPDAKKIVLVMDNLNIHSPASL